jgi:hypothetical protein
VQNNPKMRKKAHSYLVPFFDFYAILVENKEKNTLLKRLMDEERIYLDIVIHKIMSECMVESEQLNYLRDEMYFKVGYAFLDFKGNFSKLLTNSSIC